MPGCQELQALLLVIGSRYWHLAKSWDSLPQNNTDWWWHPIWRVKDMLVLKRHKTNKNNKIFFFHSKKYWFIAKAIVMSWNSSIFKLLLLNFEASKKYCCQTYYIKSGKWIKQRCKELLTPSFLTCPVDWTVFIISQFLLSWNTLSYNEQNNLFTYFKCTVMKTIKR